MKRVNWHISEAAGVNGWPNVSPTRDELRSQQTGRQKHKRQSQVTDWQLLGPDGSASERVPQIQHLIVADGQELILTGVNRQTPHLVMVALHTHTPTHAHRHTRARAHTHADIQKYSQQTQ